MAVKPVALFLFLRQDLSEQLEGISVDELLQLDRPPVGCSHHVAASHSILKSFLKKFEVENDQALDERATVKFLSVNDRCKRWELQLESTLDEILFNSLKRELDNFFYPDGLPLDLSPLNVLNYGRCGPGSSIEARGQDSYTKLFSSKLSCTDLSLYRWYKRYISKFPDWARAEEFRQKSYGDSSVVAGSHLSFVPKDDKVSRSICTEPSLNMFFQLGLGRVLELRLSNYFGIEMDKQPFKNRELAQMGSKGYGFATIDLSSASDSLGNKMLRCILPPEVLRELNRYRCPVTKHPKMGELELNMISTMGNGFTFPLQTIIFSSVVRAAMKVAGSNIRNPRGSDPGNWGVFGDDIICPTISVRYVLRLLDILGFQVNSDKTFIEGPFRESCGYDYFCGRNIRGVYVKRLRSQQDRLAVINELNLFSMRTGIRLRRTVQALLRTVTWLPVPPSENMSAGIHVPSSMAYPRGVDSNTGSIIYWRWQSVPRQIRFLEDSIWVPKMCHSRVYNPNGVYISFLARWLNGGSIAVRHDRVRYRRMPVIVPYWDYREVTHPTGWFNWQRWNTAVYFNFNEAK